MMCRFLITLIFGGGGGGVGLVKVMVFSATFNNISVILWRSVLLVEERFEVGMDMNEYKN